MTAVMAACDRARTALAVRPSAEVALGRRPDATAAAAPYAGARRADV